MLRYARSLLDSVLGKKRSLEEDISTTGTSDSAGSASKKTKVDDPAAMIYKVTITNLPNCSNKMIKAYLTEKGIPRVNKSPGWDYAIAIYKSKEEAEQAMKTIGDQTFKNKKLQATLQVVSEEEHRGRFLAKANKRNKNKTNAADDADPDITPDERLANQVTPLHKMPYDEQLKKKQRTGEKHLFNFKKDLLKLLPENHSSQFEWVKERGLPCEVLDIIASPEREGYRTKCEFTIGKNLDKEPTVGFLLGLFRHGIVSVLEPSHLKNIPDSAKRIAKAMQDYVRASKYPVYDREEKEGVWRTLMTKTQRTVMILVQIKSEGLGVEEVAEIIEDLKDYWTVRVKDQGIDVTTLLFQEWDGVSNGLTDRAPTQVLYGEGFIYEELLGCRFRISSSAFFQINTPAAELLYSKCAEWCNLDNGKKTTLLDICCGTGTIGITMAKSVDKVIGVEMVPEAIVDAKANAERNGIKNVTYYANKVENQLNVFRRQGDEEIVAVLDPPRNGVHASVVRALREAEHIDKVIYISCDAKQASPNFLTLCRPQSNRHKGVPFKPVRAVSVDLFPHSEPSELMIEFARVRPEDNDAN